MADEPEKPSYGPTWEEFEADTQRIRAERQASRAKASSESTPMPPAHPEPGTPEYSAALRQTITEAAKQGERSSEKPSAQAASPTAATFHGLLDKPFTLQDAFMFVLCELIAIPLCDASWHAIVTEKDELVRGLTGLAFGIPVGVVGVGFHWFKEKIGDWFGRTAIFWWPIVLILVFSYVTGPEIYRRATAPISSLPISAPTTSISAAVVKSQRFYSVAEKEELANRISTIYQILNSDMLELAEQWLGAYSHNLGSKQDAEQFLKEIDALHRKTLAAHKKLWEDTVNGNPNFSTELRRLIAEDAAFPKLEIAIGNFTNGVSLYFLTYDYLTPILRAQFAQLLRPFQGALFEGAGELKKWVYQSDERIAERRKSL